MKVSEAIEILQGIQAKFGDLEMFMEVPKDTPLNDMVERHATFDDFLVCDRDEQGNKAQLRVVVLL